VKNSAGDEPRPSARRRWIRWAQRAAGLTAAAVALTALYWTARVALSDWVYLEWNAQAIRRAVRLAPGNAEYYSGWAEIEPDRAVTALEMAVALNPANSLLRIELGQAAEEKGDYRKAEASLLRAVEMNHNFAPRWVLSDFYFHRRDAERFWPAVKAALATSYDDISVLFRNCWALSSDPQTILEKAIPDRPAVLTQYLVYLLGERRIEAAEPVAARVLAKPDKDAAGALLTYCDQLLEAGRDGPAVAVWNGLSRQGLIPYPAASVEAGKLTNGEFGRPSVGECFDWRFSSPDGVDLGRVGKPAVVYIGLSGNQAQSLDLLSQYVPLLPDRDYELSVKYRATGMQEESGLMCRLVPPGGGDLLQETGLLPGGDQVERDLVFRFRTRANTTLARLVLGYRRMQGTVRSEGSVMLRGMELSLRPQDGR
jgi:tetratricopeptide (TPR) repeat protein